jgi:hypothetical protein
MRGSLQLAERKVKWLASSEALLPDELRRFAPVLALLERARSQVSIQDRLVSDLLGAFFWFTLPLTQPAKRDEETVY